MADIETSVAVTAQTDGLQSGMEAAADAVGAATGAMKAQFAELSTAAQQAQVHIDAAATQIGSTIGALQMRTADITGSVSGSGNPGNSSDTGEQFRGISVSEQASGASGSDALDSQWELEQDYYEKKQAAAENDLQAQQKLLEQQELAYQQYLSNKDKLDAEAVQNSQKQWQSLLQPIQRTLDRSITGIIVGTTTVQKALSNLAQSIVADFVKSAVGTVLGGLGKSLGASLTGGASSSGNQDFSGGPTGAGKDILGGGISEGLFGSGGLAGALGLGNLFSGGGLFGGLFKGLGSLFSFERGGIVPSAAGGWMVPSTSLAMLHTNEMVLPANISQGLQTMIASGGNSAPNVTFAVSAMDSQSVATFFRNNGATLIAAINQATRNGSALRSA